jgi:hypothetical protein
MGRCQTLHMPKRRRGRSLQTILALLAFLASGATGSFLLDRANDLKGADPDRDVLPYEIGDWRYLSSQPSASG